MQIATGAIMASIQWVPEAFSPELGCGPCDMLNSHLNLVPKSRKTYEQYDNVCVCVWGGGG
jgi:hypothetical protein